MAEPPIPETLARLLAKLHSVLELELLLLLHDLPDQQWSAAALVPLVNKEPDTVRSALVSLARKGLVERRFGGESLSFRCNANDPGARIIQQLASMYVEQRALIVACIGARTPTSAHQRRDACRSGRQRDGLRRRE